MKFPGEICIKSEWVWMTRFSRDASESPLSIIFKSFAINTVFALDIRDQTEWGISQRTKSKTVMSRLLDLR